LQHYQQQPYVWKCAVVTVGVFLLLGLEVRVLITHTVFVDCFFSKIATQFLFLFFSGFFVVADVVVCLGFLSITGIVPVMQLALINRAGGLYWKIFTEVVSTDRMQ